MPYIDCPRCRARFHSGFIYEQLDMCPRCGAPLHPPRPTLAERLQHGLKRHRVAEAPDWETITGSQYAVRRRAPGQREHDDNAHHPRLAERASTPAA